MRGPQIRWRAAVLASFLLSLFGAGWSEAQQVIPQTQPPFPQPAGHRSPGKGSLGPQPIPASLLRSAIVPPPAPGVPPPSAPLSPPVSPDTSSGAGENLRDPADASTNLEEKYLLPLLLREQELLKHYGREHPEIQAIRGRIAVVREWLARQPASPPHVEPRPASASEPAAAKPGPQQAAVTVEETKPAPAAPGVPSSPAVDRVIEVRPVVAEQQGTSTTRILVQLVSILAALVVILLVQLVALLFILRRYAGRLTPQVRVEVVNSGPTGQSEPVAGEVLAQRIYLDPPDLGLRRSAPAMPQMPRHEDMHPAEEESAQHQDEAVFRQVFEDNLRLHEQLAAAGRGQ